MFKFLVIRMHKKDRRIFLPFHTKRLSILFNPI